MIVRNESQIVVDIPNKAIGNTVIKQKAHLLGLEYSHGKKHVTIELLIIPYAQAENDTYGDSLANESLFKADYKTITADMSEIVDMQGNIVNLTIEEAEAAAETYMYEFEWYREVAQNQSVILDQWITDAIVKYFTPVV